MSDSTNASNQAASIASRRVRADDGTTRSQDPTLPPPDEEPTRLLALAGAAVNRAHRETLTAMIDSIAPDVLIATKPEASVVRPALGRETDHEILEVGAGMRPDVTVTRDETCTVVALPMGEGPLDTDQIATRSELPTPVNGLADTGPASQVCLINQTVSLSVDPHARSTSLNGVPQYRGRIPDEWWTPQTTHLSTALRAGFTTIHSDTPGEEDGVKFVGIGTSDADLGAGTAPDTPQATLVTLYSNGAIDVSEVDPQSFGLRGVPEVGPTRIETLRDAGITSVDGLVETPLRQLADLSRLGRSSAQTIQTAAEARATNIVIPTGDDPLPDGDPVFIDIETDGLNPSTAWLIGVLDGGPEKGHYLSFREQAVGDGSHLQAFMSWLTDAAAGRPVVAWNGNRFDFPVITEQLRQHHPDLVAAWTDRYQFDAWYWATQKNGGNAALPGRTNKLEPVATALGWEPSTTGIDGETVARIYTAYRRRVTSTEDTTTVAEPDWDRLDRYCEDDVRALATIYEHLEAAARQEPATKTPTGENSSQGSLADFS